MRIASRSPKQDNSGNQQYCLGEKQTPFGPAGEVVWLYEVVKIDPRKSGWTLVYTYQDREPICVKSDNEELKRLRKDYERYKAEVHQETRLHSYHILEQKYGSKGRR